MSDKITRVGLPSTFFKKESALDDLEKTERINELLRTEVKTLKTQVGIRDELLSMCPYFENFDMNEVEIQETDNVEDNRSVEEKYTALKSLYKKRRQGIRYLAKVVADEMGKSSELRVELDEYKANYLKAVQGRKEFRELYKQAREKLKEVNREIEGRKASS